MTTPPVKAPDEGALKRAFDTYSLGYRDGHAAALAALSSPSPDMDGDRTGTYIDVIVEQDLALARLKDPNAVHIAMLRGDIAKPTVDQIAHIYGKPVLDDRSPSSRFDGAERAARIIDPDAYRDWDKRISEKLGEGGSMEEAIAYAEWDDVGYGYWDRVRAAFRKAEKIIALSAQSQESSEAANGNPKSQRIEQSSRNDGEKS